MTVLSRPRAIAALLALCFTVAGPASAEERSGSFGLASVSGIVSTVSGNIVTVMNGRLAIDTTGARFEGRGGSSSIADVRPGVRIAATVRNADAAPGAMLQASLVVILDLPDGTLSGPITAVNTGAGIVTLLGATVQITSATQIHLGREGGSGTIAGLSVGDLAIVEVRVTGTGLVAESIRVLPQVPSVSVEGTVKSIGNNSWVITSREGSDITVIVNAQTRIEGSPKVGDTVRVVGSRDAAGNLVAAVIFPAIGRTRVTKPPTLLEGTVKSIGATSWTITGRDGRDVVVQLNAQTRIEGSPRVGDSVVVFGTTDSTGTLLAVAITKKPTLPTLPEFGQTSFEGTVQSITSGVWTVENTRVMVTRATTIAGSPAVGNRVRVTGYKAPDGSYVAVTIARL